MNTRIYRYSLILFLLLLVSCGKEESESTRLPYFDDSDMTPVWVAPDSVDMALTHTIGEFSLTDQDGKTVTQDMMNNQITVVDFFFTRCPGICPTLSKNMARVQDSLKSLDDLLLLSYSVTPDVDSVPVLKKYAEAQGAIEGTWHLLTGNKEEIYDLARESYFSDVDTGANAFLHTELFYLIDGERRIRGVYNGTLGTDVARLIEDIQVLQEETKG